MRANRLFDVRSSLVLFLLLAGMAGAQTPPEEAATVPAVPPPYEPPAPIPTPPPMLGVNIDTAPIWSGYGWETGIRVVSVWPGYPTSGRLDPGDIITRVNGYRTRTIADFRYAMALVGPMVNLRVRDVRTGQILDLAPIYLYPAAAVPATAAPAPTAPPPSGTPAPPGRPVPGPGVP